MFLQRGLPRYSPVFSLVLGLPTNGLSASGLSNVSPAVAQDVKSGSNPLGLGDLVRGRVPLPDPDDRFRMCDGTGGDEVGKGVDAPENELAAAVLKS